MHALGRICRCLLYTLLLVVLVCADDVTVYMNDTRVVTFPPNLWSNPDIYTFPICGYLRFMNGTGQSVSLSFTGAVVTVNLFPYIDGSIVQIAIDGTNITRIDTYNLSGIGATGYNCTPIPWTSDVLSGGQHTITVTEVQPNPAISIGLVAMLSFVYTTGANVSGSTSTAHSGSSTSAGTSIHKSPGVGAVVGAVVGGIIVLLIILVVVLWLFFCRRRRRLRSPTPTPGVFEHNNLDTAERPGFVHAIPSQTGAFESDTSAFQGNQSLDIGQRSQPDVALPAFATKQSGTSPNMHSNSQTELPSATPPPTRPREPTENPKLESLATPSSSNPSHSRPHAVNTNYPPPALHSTSPSRTIPSNLQYSPDQLVLLTKLSDSGTHGSIIAAVARSMLRLSGGSGSGAAGEVIELEASDLDLLQRLADSGADGSVIKGVAESMFERGASRAGVVAALGVTGSVAGEDPPPTYDFTGT